MAELAVRGPLTPVRFSVTCSALTHSAAYFRTSAAGLDSISPARTAAISWNCPCWASARSKSTSRSRIAYSRSSAKPTSGRLRARCRP